ncbi:LysR family transcriptional regulator [Alteromonas sp. V450]|uniref:LysR family transcriptional regulator n=1 Tax=Alteromonas sp. V450 TaxID=1912139 RepID=UPI0008FF0DEA|nr:LysR family transcriptional regulator [Alteromonas sp. V450]OJF68133.1 LysR family transcriptional regulator [Alteromonas sp. V450]
MDISYKQVKAFVEVANSSTFAEAAICLHLSQPALSTSIKKLEAQLGGKLFERTTRHVAMTPEGEMLLPNALRLLRDWENTFSDMKNVFAMSKGQLTVCSMPSFAESLLPTLLKQFHLKAPNINLRVVDVVMEQVIHEVLAGRCELGFSFEPERKDGLMFEPLFDDQFVVVATPEQNARLGARISWSDCLNFSLVMMNRGSAVRQWTQEKLQRYGSLKIVAETGQLATLGKLIKSGLGLSIMPSICSKQMQDLGLVVRKIDDNPLSKRIGLITNSRKGLSVPAQQLWNLAIDEYKTN